MPGKTSIAIVTDHPAFETDGLAFGEALNGMHNEDGSCWWLELQLPTLMWSVFAGNDHARSS